MQVRALYAAGVATRYTESGNSVSEISPGEVQGRAKPGSHGVYEALRGDILTNSIPPGTRVNIDAVARRLGVSPTPVREALHQLRGDNLVVAASGRGYSTTPLLNLRELRDLFEFRLLVEPWAARAAAVDRLDNPAYRMGDELEGFAAQVAGKSDIRQELVSHDARFHDLILSATGNEVIRSAYRQTHCHLHIFRLYPADIDGRITVQEHRAVWQAVRDCDPDGAADAMHSHLAGAYQRFAEAFTDDTAAGAPALRESAAPATHIG
jgi:DNA-binding GntR family transcriptional regulator